MRKFSPLFATLKKEYRTDRDTLKKGISNGLEHLKKGFS